MRAYEAFDQGKYLTALHLAVKAAEQGDPQAHTLVGRIYAEGNGAPRTSALAAQWYARGAELGDPEGMFAYGVMLAEGQGVARTARPPGRCSRRRPSASTRSPTTIWRCSSSRATASRRTRIAPSRTCGLRPRPGVAAAQYDLGTLYATGTGVDPNAFEAAKWIGKAAAAGHTEAQVDYAVILFQGHGVPPDPKRGAQLFRAAAEKGVAVAQNRLARCYAHGAGVETNLVEAAKWHLIAKAAGEADESLDKMVAKLSKADRAKAQKAADEWRDRSKWASSEVHCRPDRRRLYEPGFGVWSVPVRTVIALILLVPLLASASVSDAQAAQRRSEPQDASRRRTGHFAIARSAPRWWWCRPASS